MLGLALEGGGAKGAFHMGAVKAFYEQGYRFHGVTGTSIGALNGAIIAQGDFELGYEFWEKVDTSFLFDIEPSQMIKIKNKKLDKHALRYLSSKLKDIIENKGLDTSRIRQILETLVNEEKLRSSKIDFGIVTVNISDLKPLELYKEDIPAGMIVNYLMASANLPVFKSEPIEGKYYLDGGFYDNCPINLLVRKGYKEVIAIRTFSIGIVRKVEDKDIKIIDVVPSEDLGKILDFDHDNVKRNLKMGYFDAMRTIKGLLGKKYYIEPVFDDSIFFESFLSIPDNAINDIGKIMAIPQMEPKRMLFEKIIPSLAGILDLPITSTYQDIILSLLEIMAEERKIDRYKIFSLNEFVGEIRKSDLEVEEDSKRGSVISHITEGTKLAPLFAKDVILSKAGEEILKRIK